MASLAVAGAVVIPAASASAREDIPPINCGIVSCTYPIEEKVEYVSDSAKQEAKGVRECIENSIGAIENILQGTPQPAVCNL